MEAHHQITSDINDQPAPELVEENGEPTPADLLAECDEPLETKVANPLPKLSTPEGTELKSVLEFSADLTQQFNEAYRQEAAGPVSSILKTVTLAVICASVHILVTQQSVWLISIAALLIALVIVFRILYVRRRAHSQVVTKYVLTDDSLQASGPDPSNEWRLRISEIDRAVLVSGADNREHLVLSTRSETFVLRGLDELKKLWNSLPQEVQVDCSALKQKLQQFADSMYECKDADQIEKFNNAKELQKCLQECIQDFPDARVLTRDFRLIRRITIFTLVFSCIPIGFALLGYAQIALPIIPIILFGFLPAFLDWRKTADCHYVFCPDALFEIDSKRGAVNMISLNRLSTRAEIVENDGVSLYSDGQMHIPVRIGKDEEDYIKRCLKKYPNPT